jgi:voltage-gated sodium channel
MAQTFKAIVESPLFQNSILLLILLAAVLVGLETYPHIMEHHGSTLHLLDRLVIWVFAFEAAMKMAAHGRRFYDYFRDPWNCFDFAIVAICFMPLDAHFAAVLRLVRVLRALRLVSVMPRLQMIVGALIKSFPSMGYVGALLLLHFYIYAVLGTFLFRDNDPVHFGTLQATMLSLFRIVTLDNWTTLLYTQMHGADVVEAVASGGEALAGVPKPVTAVIYFVSFILMGTMIMLNLFIGVIISGMNEIQLDAEREKKDRHIEQTGQATLGDELAELERQLESLHTQLRLIRRRANHVPAAV